MTNTNQQATRIELDMPVDNPLGSFDITVRNGDGSVAFETEARHEEEGYEMGDTMGVCVTMEDLESAFRFCVAIANGKITWPTTNDEAAALEEMEWDD